MIKRSIKNHKLYIIAVMILLSVPLLMFSRVTSERQERKAYTEAGGRIVVIFKDTMDEASLGHFADKYSTAAKVTAHIGDYALFSVENTKDFDEILTGISSEPQVLSAQSDVPVRVLSTTDDPFSDTQWYIDNPGYYANYSEVMKLNIEVTGDIDMDVPQAWEAIAGAGTGVAEREVVVAVVDTGVDYTHPDLKDSMWVNKGEIPGDNIDNDKNGYIDDVYGWDFYNDDSSVCHYNSDNKADPEDDDNHGTHVAGIIAAAANNKTGIAGVASDINVKIMSLKMTGGEDGEGSISDAIEAIKYATMMGADVCNLSWGTTIYDAGLEEVMKESGMLFVAAAGNSGEDNDVKPMYPACLDLNNMISVTSINADGRLTRYSNFGINSVDIAAPGDDIYSTIVGSYDTLSGSSMAAPQVSAVAAMLYAYNDNVFASNIKEIITGNLKKLDSLKDYTVYGGIPSAYQAVSAAGKLLLDTEPPVMSLETIFNQEEMTVPVKAEDAGPAGIRVIKWIFGKKTAADFGKGANGTTVKDGQASLSKAGFYTFYAADYAGNETAVTYEVREDSTVPKLTTTFSVADNYKYRTVTVDAIDTESGIKRIKYMPGVRKAEEFLPSGAGTEVKIKDGKGIFKVKKDGVYTVFASDYRGNIIVKPIIVKTVKSTSFSFAETNKTITVGDKYILSFLILPIGSTDKITYTSSNRRAAVVSTTGKVIALGEGSTLITARTSSGLTATCLITVKARE
jgi:subtilisin family serine protease